MLESFGVAAAGTAVNSMMNMFNTQIAEEAQDRYMQKWGSAEAQMKSFRKAGINPLGIGAQLTGAAGDTNVGTQLSNYDWAGAFNDSVNSVLNPTVAAKTESETASNNANANKTNVEAEGQEIENEINRDTKEDQKRQKIAEANVTDEEARQLKQINDNYPELFELQKREIDSKIREIDGKIKVYDKQIEQIDQEINESKKRIDVMESQRILNMSEADRAVAEADLAREKKVLTEKEVARLQLQNERDNAYGAVDPSVQKWMEIRDNEGEEAANKWLDEQYNVIKKMNEGEFSGKAQGELDVMSGHSGHVGQTIDAVRHMSGVGKNFNVNDILGSFGIYLDSEGRLQFKPIVQATEWIKNKFGGKTPTYEEWSKDVTKVCNNMQTKFNNQLMQGNITKQQYDDYMQGVIELRSNINEGYYEKHIK